jgi:hypothetical protein
LCVSLLNEKQIQFKLHLQRGLRVYLHIASHYVFELKFMIIYKQINLKREQMRAAVAVKKRLKMLPASA